MPNINMIRSILTEYGARWAVNRSLYSTKLKALRICPALESLFEMRTVYPRRLDLFELNIVALQQFLRSLSQKEKEELIHSADKACEGIIFGFSSIDLDYGMPIDWQLNPFTGKRCDVLKKWYRIPDFDSERGDIKVVWEASRFSHFLTLARAFLLTKEEKYYNSFSNQLEDWLKENPYGYGANFKCGQECSIRMVNTLLAYTVFQKAGRATDHDLSNVKNLIDRCYRKVLSNFFYAYRCIKNNHTISELMGMVVGAWCCEDQVQLENAFQMLNEVIKEQFTEDGGYLQFSFNYQRLALQDLECIFAIENRTGKKLTEENRLKIRNAAYLMYQCQDECGDMPNYGSNDGALIFPVTSCGYRNFRPLINTVYALTSGKQLYEKGSHQEELIWFGNKDLEDYPVKKLDRISSHFEKAGLFTIRSQDSHSWVMIILNDYKTRPSHLDQLHVDMWVNGINVMCDGGTYSYASDLGKILLKTEGHNTATVNGKEQMKLYGPFLIYDWTKRNLKKEDSSVFEGTMRSDYSHFRRVAYQNGIYHITDTVDEDFELLFHTPCTVELNGSTVLLSQNDHLIAQLHSEGIIQIKKSIRSLYYLRQEPCNCIIIKAKKGHQIHTTIQIEGEKQNG